ncbi:MAG: alpha/beta fold hydrolase [Ilumatobacteraceae bacterium]|nr:alpha/beta fold hydrolase [Ilumatobacteraceae bacterium]MDP4735391.1 alpha/beta fold hydrolase [Ilumatobacteraceae bacterium]MDP4902951.1 alpha/beta fold hydrolase [Ilumatobacteraceae bacterium]
MWQTAQDRTRRLSPMLSNKQFGNGPRAVLVHGFTQTHETWVDVIDSLKQNFEVIAVDAPNHGDSCDISLNLESGAKAIGEVGGNATYIGYSLGGRFCLTLALAEPQLVSRLVLISTTAGIEDKELRSERIRNDEELARRIEQIGVNQFIDEWLNQSLFAGLNNETNQRGVRLKNTAIGLSSSLRLCGAGRQQPTWSRLKELTMPVLVIAGANDEKYRRLAERLVSEIGDNATLKIVENSGHTPHLEQPEIFQDLLSNFISTQ